MNAVDSFFRRPVEVANLKDLSGSTEDRARFVHQLNHPQVKVLGNSQVALVVGCSNARIDADYCGGRLDLLPVPALPCRRLERR